MSSSPTSVSRRHRGEPAARPTGDASARLVQRRAGIGGRCTRRRVASSCQRDAVPLARRASGQRRANTRIALTERRRPEHGACALHTHARALSWSRLHLTQTLHKVARALVGLRGEQRACFTQGGGEQPSAERNHLCRPLSPPSPVEICHALASTTRLSSVGPPCWDRTSGGL